MVNSDLAQKARGVLADTMVDSEEEERAEISGEARLRREGTETSPTRLALWVVTAFLGAVILAWILYQLT